MLRVHPRARCQLSAAFIAVTSALVVAVPSARADGGLDPRVDGTGFLFGDLGRGEPPVDLQPSLLSAVAYPGDQWLVSAFLYSRGGLPSSEVLMRFNSDATLDHGFGDGFGVRSQDVAAFDPRVLAVLPNGDVVAAGRAGLVTLLDGTGALRRRFVPTAIPHGIGEVRRMVALADGMVVVAGVDERGVHVSVTDPYAADPVVQDLAVPVELPDGSQSVDLGTDAGGRILVTSCSTAPSGCGVAAFGADGQLDASFASDGVLALPTVVPGGGCDVAVGFDGRLASACDIVADHAELRQFLPTGAPDLEVAPVVLPRFSTVLFEGTGRLLSIGLETQGATWSPIVRAFGRDGADPSFGTGGRTVLPLSSIVGSDLYSAPMDLRWSEEGFVYAFGRDQPPGSAFWWVAALTAPTGPAARPPVALTSRFVPATPTRLLDTRDGTGGRQGPLGPGETARLAVAGVGPVPAAAVTAVAVNVTATDTLAPGYVTVWPSGTGRPRVSNLNIDRPDDTVANLAIVPVGADGAIDLFSQNGTHLVVDLVGWFEGAAHATGGRYRPSDPPERALDTRRGASTRPGPDSTTLVHVAGLGGIPSSGVRAIAVTVTGTGPTAAGYVSAWSPDEPRPATSTLNLGPGDTRQNFAIVPVSRDGNIALYSQSGSDLVVDITGWFTDDTAPDATAGLFVPVPPHRMLDTRHTADPPSPGTIVRRQIGDTNIVPGHTATAVIMNVTATGALGPGFVTTYPDATALPEVSTLNVPGPDATIANLTATRLGIDDAIAGYSQTGTHIILDIAGWFTGTTPLTG